MFMVMRARRESGTGCDVVLDIVVPRAFDGPVARNDLARLVGLGGRSAVGGVCVLDRDPDAVRLCRGHRETDLQDSLLVAGRDVVRVHPGREPDRPGRRSVAELRPVRPALLLASLGMNPQHLAVEGNLDVRGGIQAGKLSANHVMAVAHQFFDSERLSRRKRQQSRLQRVGQVREHRSDYGRRRPAAHRYSHHALPFCHAV
jgi:hypothetical protein